MVVACDRCGEGNYGHEDVRCGEQTLALGVCAVLCWGCRRDWYAHHTAAPAFEEFQRAVFVLEHWKNQSAWLVTDLADGLRLRDAVIVQEQALAALARRWLKDGGEDR